MLMNRFDNFKYNLYLCFLFLKGCFLAVVLMIPFPKKNIKKVRFFPLITHMK